jgi:hypothetical protein
MTNDAIEYLTDKQGNPSAVVIPIAFWRQIFPENVDSIESVAEGIGRAMDEAATTPLLGREAALAFLAEESD